MSLNDTMTGLMNAVRSRYALTDKMSLADATSAISKVVLYTPVELGFSQTSNSSDFYQTDSGHKYVAKFNDKNGATGPYQYYDQRIIKPGKRYNFSALVRGTIRLKKIGEESNGILLDLPLDAEKWQRLSFNFIAKRDIVIYGTAKVGDWIEVKDAQYSELGGGEGVIKPNLIANWVNDLIDPRVSLSDGVLSFNNPNGEISSADFYTINGGIKLTPGHTYQLSYRVRGTGYVRTYIYAYNDKETGAYVDNGHTVQLENSWQTVTYTFKYNPVEITPLSFSFRPGNSDQDTCASKGEAADFCLVDISQ